MNAFIHTSGTTNGPPETAVPRPKRGSLGPGGWPERITAETLRSPAAVERLWQFALGCDWVAAVEREQFFAVACCVGRMSRDKLNMKNPG
ncbi:MAG: hypothetical protein NT069_32465, partial [Planctomycetota bacterium]|nr:hypothetical protein [Planctomycetota bacterium]